MASLAEQFLEDVHSAEEDEDEIEGVSNSEHGSQNDDPQPDENNQPIANTTFLESDPPILSTLRDALSRVKLFQNQLPTEENIYHTDENTDVREQYDLVIECAERIAEVDDQIAALHIRLRKAYGPRFPELETLMFNPLDYARVVQLTANQDDLAKVDLREILPSGTVITVQLTAAASTGRLLKEDELQKVMHLCNTLISLDEMKTKILDYIESRAGYMAPNLVVIVGGEVAAKLMGLAGGLNKLAEMPSCNIKVLGKVIRLLQGTSTATTRVHEGIIFTSPLVAKLPKQYRSKAGEVVTGKASLAARVDACRQQRDGAMGRKLRKQLEEKFEKWQEPPPAKTAKPLPIPGEESKRKHRGGKRARREKERYGMTDVRRMANRVKFGEQEETLGNDLENEGFGMLGAEGSRRLRIQSKKTNNASNAAKRLLAKQKRRENTSEAAALGLNTSLAFTPVQGIELGAMTPAPGGVGLGSMDAADGTQSNYFSSSTPFLGVSLGTRHITKKKKGDN